MFKKGMIAVVGVVALLSVLAPTLLGFSVWHLGHALQVASSMSAKLACSSKYVSQFDDNRIEDDLASYSPATRLVELTHNTDLQQTHASMLGLTDATAQYREGLGCALLFDQVSPLEQISVSRPQANQFENWPMGEAADDIAPIIQETLDDMLRIDNQQGYQTRALLVVQNGKLLAESYGVGIDATTPLLGWSMAKSVTAMLIGRYQYLNSEATEPSPLFKQWQDERRDIRLQDMLHMASGLDFDETYAPGSDATHMLFTAPSAADVALKSLSVYSPGAHFSYSSGTTNMLSRYFTELNGSPQNAMNFAWQQLFKPLNMANSVFEMDNAGDFVGSSYLYASGRDWARLGYLMVNEGEFAGQQLLPKEWIKAASTPNNSSNEKAYGYQFWLNDGDAHLRWPQLPKDAYAMQGNRKQTVMIIPSLQLVIVRLGWSKDDYPFANKAKRLIDTLKR